MSKLYFHLCVLVLLIGSFCTSASAAEPAWLAGKPMNQWFEINGTSGTGGATLNPWGGFTLRDDTAELFVAAAGGHHDSYDNRVVSIKLTDDNPEWILRAAPSTSDMVLEDVPYYKDGKPSARHIYQHNFWVPAINRIILCGARYVYGSAVEYMTVDGFNPDTNTWDPQNTWPNMTNYGTVRERNSSIIWTTAFKQRVDLKAGSITSPVTRLDLGVELRWPVAHDTLRHQLFGLQFADGQGYGVQYGVQASRVKLGPGSDQYLPCSKQVTITFKSSTALDTFISSSLSYASMDYDPINDRFLFYGSGEGDAAARIYVITPNEGTEWEMGILALGQGSVVPPQAVSGINSRFRYVPGLNVFVMLPYQASNLYAIRIGNVEPLPDPVPVMQTPSGSAPQTQTQTPSSSPKSSTIPKSATSSGPDPTAFLAVVLLAVSSVALCL